MSTDYEFLPVTHDEIPVEKTFVLEGKSYAIEFNYNDLYDFYTMKVSDESSGDLLFSTKLTYLCDALDAVVKGITLTRSVIPALTRDLDSDYPSDAQVNAATFDEVYICLI